MALRKITDGDLANKTISTLPDVPNLGSPQMQQRFDAYPNVIRQIFNENADNAYDKSEADAKTHEFVNQAVFESGGGDMFKAVYDPLSRGAALGDIYAYADAKCLTNAMTIMVGSGGAFPTINAALRSLSKYPSYRSPAVYVNLRLRPGFVMAEQVMVRNGLDLSWVIITSEDAEVPIQRSALTTDVGGGFPAFSAMIHSALPQIQALFRMDASGVGTNRHGIMAAYNSSVIVASGHGVLNAGGSGMYITQASVAGASGARFDGAGGYGLLVDAASTLHASSISAKAAGAQGVHASNASRAFIAGSNVTGAAAGGIHASLGSVISANSSDARMGVGDNVGDIQVTEGGTIIALSAIGGQNIASNAVTADGVIFR